MRTSAKVAVVATAVAAMMTTSACSKVGAAKNPPKDLCALMTAPPLTQFLSGGTFVHRAQDSDLTATAGCRGAAGADTLEVTLERHGGTKKRSAGKWAERAYKSDKDTAGWTFMCAQAPPSPRLGKDSYECRSGQRFEITVRKGADVLSLTVLGRIADNPATAETLRGYADQILKGL